MESVLVFFPLSASWLNGLPKALAVCFRTIGSVFSDYLVHPSLHELRFCYTGISPGLMNVGHCVLRTPYTKGMFFVVLVYLLMSVRSIIFSGILICDAAFCCSQFMLSMRILDACCPRPSVHYSCGSSCNWSFISYRDIILFSRISLSSAKRLIKIFSMM